MVWACRYVDKPSERASGDNCGQIRWSGGSNRSTVTQAVVTSVRSVQCNNLKGHTQAGVLCSYSYGSKYIKPKSSVTASWIGTLRFENLGRFPGNDCLTRKDDARRCGKNGREKGFPSIPEDRRLSENHVCLDLGGRKQTSKRCKRLTNTELAAKYTG
jgi:hypothetical protein